MEGSPDSRYFSHIWAVGREIHLFRLRQHPAWILSVREWRLTRPPRKGKGRPMKALRPQSRNPMMVQQWRCAYCARFTFYMDWSNSKILVVSLPAGFLTAAAHICTTCGRSLFDSPTTRSQSHRCTHTYTHCSRPLLTCTHGWAEMRVAAWVLSIHVCAAETRGRSKKVGLLSQLRLLLGDGRTGGFQHKGVVLLVWWLHVAVQQFTCKAMCTLRLTIILVLSQRFQPASFS
jgi:hypothetical protein